MKKNNTILLIGFHHNKSKYLFSVKLNMINNNKKYFEK
jgi:hypothetical protein